MPPSIEPGTEMVHVQSQQRQASQSPAHERDTADDSPTNKPKTLQSHTSSRSAFGQPTKSETDLPPAYLEYLNTLRKAWPDLPELTITYKDFSYSSQIPVKRNEIPNLFTAIVGSAKGLNVFRDRTKETKEFRPLNSASGIIRPGEMTLVLAPPGHGKSMLLKGLAGRLEREHDNLRGEIRWNGLTAKESAAAGQQLSKLAVFVEQGDVHFPMLTVRETFEFALRNSNADAKELNSPEFAKLQEKKVDLMLELLGLKECADTIVGNGMMRGVSGGQKKRVTLGEMMITQARALMLDEISTGLDSAATFDIASALKKWTRVMRGSAVVALLQPAPEVFEMFDNIILLRDGQVVFHGTRAQLRAHFDALRIEPNEEIDFADWLVEFLTDPVSVWKRDIEQRGRRSSMRSFRSYRSQSQGPSEQQGQPKQQHQQQPGAAEASPRGEPAPPASNYIALPRDNKVAQDSRESSQSQAREVVFHIGDDFAAAQQEGQAANKQTNNRQSVAFDNIAVNGNQPNGYNQANGVQANGAGKTKSLGQIVNAQGVPLSTLSLVKAYKSSTVYTDMMQEIGDTNAHLAKKNVGLELQRAKQQDGETGAKQVGGLGAFTRAQFYRPYAHPLWRHMALNLGRQFKVMTRSPGFVGPRLFQAVFMGLVLGSLFWMIGTGFRDYPSRYGLILYGLIYVSFGNMAEVPLASEFKLVVYKQVDAGFYSTFAYVTSVILMHFPLAILETFIFSTIVYWMTGFVNDIGRWFFYYLLVLLTNLSMGALFRTVAYSTPNPNVAANLAGPITSVCLLFGGFLITKDKIPDWLIWVYYISPFSWGLRSGALSEFHSGRYENGLGDQYLREFQFTTNDAYKWAGVGYLAGFFILFIGLSAISLKAFRTWLTVGTRRTDLTEEEAQAAEEQMDVQVRIGAKTTSMIAAAELKQQQEDESMLDFKKMDLSWIDLKYEVTVHETNEETGKKETRQRQLLAGVNGYAKAGELTALMGSSGAGKTTLMDVIAGRKTEGKITGKILVDGHPQEFPSFNRLMGYCEQVDVHVGTDSVREAIDFSARLRLPSTVTAEARKRFVDQILEDLELTPLAGRLVGDQNIEGLSPGELKRLTIGVELAANPTFLFLDEPTSGLDSRAALIVLRVIRKIARRGRSVVCTIHQPSAELFCMFDRLLLLKAGGKESYFGPIGESGVDLVDYFMNAPIGEEYYRPQLPERVNPASWMLDVIGAGTSAKGKIAQYDEVYKKSDLRKENMKVVEELSRPKDNKPAYKFDGLYASTYWAQFYNVTSRLFANYWRDTAYQVTKFTLMIMIGTIFGLVWRDINDDDEAGMMSKVSAIYMGAGFMGVLQCSNALPVVYRLREVFYRERSSNMYAPFTFSFGLAVVEIPFLFIASFLFTLPFYFLVHFEYDAQQFFRYLSVMFITAIEFCYLGQFLATALPNIQVANIIQGMFFSFFFLFAGIFRQKSTMPIGWQWMYYIDFIPKSLLPLSIWQFYCEGPDCPTVESTQFGGRITKWHWIQNFLATGKGWERYWIAYLLLTIVILRLLNLLVVQKVSYVKR